MVDNGLGMGDVEKARGLEKFSTKIGGVMNTKQTKLVLKRKWSFGMDGHQTDQDSLLFRPYQRLVKTWRPMGTLTHLFLSTREPSLQTDVRLLGTLCYTTGSKTDSNMILYFPGYRGTSLTNINHALQPIKTSPPLLKVDHFSLEPSRRRWHITGVGSGKNKPRVKDLGVREIASNLVCWFAMSVRDDLEFELVYRKNTFTFPCPNIDAERRMMYAIKSVQDAVFNIVDYPDARLDDGPSFLHFEFTVQYGTAPEPVLSSSLHLPLPPLADMRMSVPFPVYVHPISLVNFNGTVQITATRLSGILPFPVILGYHGACVEVSEA